MPDRRRVDVPWHLSLHNGDKQAALAAKKSFCAQLDAAGRSLSPCAEILRDEAEYNEVECLHDRLPEPRESEAEKQHKRRKIRHSSRTPSVESSKRVGIEILFYEGNVDDLYGTTPEAFTEDSMEADEEWDTAVTQFPIEGKSPTLTQAPSDSKNQTPMDRSIGDKRTSVMATREIVNISDDSESSSNSDPEHVRGTINPTRDGFNREISQNEDRRARQASRASTKEPKNSKADQYLLDTGNTAEQAKLSATTHPKIPSTRNARIILDTIQSPHLSARTTTSHPAVDEKSSRVPGLELNDHIKSFRKQKSSSRLRQFRHDLQDRHVPDFCIDVDILMRVTV